VPSRTRVWRATCLRRPPSWSAARHPRVCAAAAAGRYRRCSARATTKPAPRYCARRAASRSQRSALARDRAAADAARHARQRTRRTNTRVRGRGRWRWLLWRSTRRGRATRRFGRRRATGDGHSDGRDHGALASVVARLGLGSLGCRGPHSRQAGRWANRHRNGQANPAKWAGVA
jgi:hypothetical protein